MTARLHLGPLPRQLTSLLTSLCPKGLNCIFWGGGYHVFKSEYHSSPTFLGLPHSPLDSIPAHGQGWHKQWAALEPGCTCSLPHCHLCAFPKAVPMPSCGGKPQGGRW